VEATGGSIRMTLRCAYDEHASYTRLVCRVSLYEEESEYENASYRHSAESSKEPHIEPAVLYQPLPVSEPTLNGTRGELAEQCVHGLTQTSRASACAEYVSLFGEALNAIKKGWRAVKSAARAAWRYVGEQTVSWSEFEGRVKKVFETGKETFGLAKCAYEVFDAKGPCESP
jgi:hypothetical protein